VLPLLMEEQQKNYQLTLGPSKEAWKQLRIPLEDNHIWRDEVNWKMELKGRIFIDIITTEAKLGDALAEFQWPLQHVLNCDVITGLAV
jgi:hypothetical protein